LSCLVSAAFLLIMGAGRLGRPSLAVKGRAMGRVKARVGGDGVARYTAYYRDGDREVSAGTFGVRREAEREWRRRERDLAQNAARLRAAGRCSVAAYAASWFPAHVCEASTRQSYAFWLERYVLPIFGHVRLDRLSAAMVRDALAKLGRDGASRDVLEAVRCVLGAMYTTAVADRLVAFHPCYGVKLAPEVRAPMQVLSPQELDLVLSLLPDRQAALLVETAVETGCRWGELAELRAGDLDVSTGILTVSRTVVELHRRFHPTGGRFLVKPYPKNRRARRLRVRPALLEALGEYIAARQLGPRDLLFTGPGRGGRRGSGAGAVGTGGQFTEPNVLGRRYRHGTAAGYGPGGCRCEACRAAVADYRARRRAAGRDRPRITRTADLAHRHIARGWFRTRRWQLALRAAGIDRKVTFHDLRHAHASWLLEGGASLQIVSERLGHASMQSTFRYLHTLPDADESALAALDQIRPAAVVDEDVDAPASMGVERRGQQRPGGAPVGRPLRNRAPDRDAIESTPRKCESPQVPSDAA
jgi:integrase